MFYVVSRVKGVEVLAKFPWKIGIVTFMLYPELIKSDEGAANRLKVLLEDPYFELIEVGYIGDTEWARIVELNKKFGKEFARALQPEVLAKGINPSELDEEKRRKNVELLLKEVRVAGERGMRAVALCSGPNVPEELKSKAIEALIKSICVLAEEASKYGMNVYVETFDYQWDKKQLLGTLSEAVKVIEKVRENFRNVYILWDLSHGPLLNETPDVLASYPDYIGHIHIGCAKKVDDKLYDWHPGFYRPGALNDERDVAKLIAVLHDIGYGGAVSFEVKPEKDQLPLEVLHTAKSVLMRAYQLFLESQL